MMLSMFPMERPPEKDPAKVKAMFSGIAGRYDVLNHLLSANMDRKWRRSAAAKLPRDSSTILDLAGGTGDLTLAVGARLSDAQVVCCDFCRPMLQKAGKKFNDPRFSRVEGDALNLPFKDSSFDGVTVGFGVRNFSNLDRGLQEIHRVLEPGGTLVILEFTRPSEGLMGKLYQKYLSRLLPKVGDGISGKSGPYGYLARSIQSFPDAPTLAGLIRQAGFQACDWEVQTFGIVAIHRAIA